MGYRKQLAIIIACLCLIAAPFAVRAQVTLPDGKYNSVTAYPAGTWDWHKVETNEVMRMKFGPGSTFFYENVTTGLQHYGQFAMLPDGNVRVTMGRSCDNHGASCQNRKEPFVVVDPISPVSANVFMSNEEKWERVRGKWHAPRKS